MRRTFFQCLKCTKKMHFVLANDACLEYPSGRRALRVAKKLHVEITPANWHRMKDYMEEYNADPARVSTRYKPADVINLALHQYLKTKKGAW